MLLQAGNTTAAENVFIVLLTVIKRDVSFLNTTDLSSPLRVIRIRPVNNGYNPISSACS